jgi:hypothetical protein
MRDEEAIVDSASRRSFLLGLAAAAALPALPAATEAQSTAASAMPASGTAPGTGGASASSPEIDSLMAIVTLRYGSYLKSDEVPMVRRALERQYASVALLKKVPITNSDAPDCLFIPDGR